MNIKMGKKSQLASWGFLCYNRQMSKHHHLTRKIAGLVLLIFTTILVFGSFSTIWAITLPVRDFETFFTKQIAQQ